MLQNWHWADVTEVIFFLHLKHSSFFGKSAVNSSKIFYQSSSSPYFSFSLCLLFFFLPFFCFSFPTSSFVVSTFCYSVTSFLLASSDSELCYPMSYFIFCGPFYAFYAFFFSFFFLPPTLFCSLSDGFTSIWVGFIVILDLS